MQVCREMPHISNMYFLEEVITVRSLRSAVAQEFRKIPTDDLKVRSSFFAGWCVKVVLVRSVWHTAYGTSAFARSASPLASAVCDRGQRATCGANR